MNKNDLAQWATILLAIVTLAGIFNSAVGYKSDIEHKLKAMENQATAAERKIASIETTISNINNKTMGRAGPQGLKGEKGEAGTNEKYRSEIDAMQSKINSLEELVSDLNSKPTGTKTIKVENVSKNGPHLNLDQAQETGNFIISFKELTKEGYGEYFVFYYTVFNKSNMISKYCMNSKADMFSDQGRGLTRRMVAGLGEFDRKERPCKEIPPGVTLKAYHVVDANKDEKSIQYYKYNCGPDCLFEFRDLQPQ